MARMRFRHAPEIWADHPALAAGVIVVDGVGDVAAVDDAVDGYLERARRTVAAGPVSALPQIQAWRRAFTAMGVRPSSIGVRRGRRRRRRD